MKTLLLRNATLLTLLLVTGSAFAQGPGRHAGGRSGLAASPTGLAYGSGYQARRMQQAERESQRARHATTTSKDECASATAPPREPEPARAKEAGQNPAPALRDTCAATKP
ncbi:MAG: hypothetical protein IV092_00150 [Burkholderiaceae bacterium]|nr:hypothetical protein [Burkholderiaceae bacterium]